MIYRSGTGLWRVGQPGIATARPSAAWTPLDLGAKLVGWWDFSDASTLYTDAGATPVSADADPIYQANDKSGNGIHLVQATLDNRPLYKQAIHNGLDVLYFDTTQKHMASAAAPSAATDNFCLVLVVQQTNTLASVGLGGGGYGATNTSCRTNTGKKGFVFASTWISSGSAADTNLRLQVLRRTSGTASLYEGGGAAVVTSALEPLAAVRAALSGTAVGNGPLVGYHCEALWLVGESVADVNNLGAYLADKWGPSWADIA